MDDTLYDASWTLYSIHSTSQSYITLPTADSTRQSRLATQLRSYLDRTKVPTDPYDSEAERTGTLRDCTWTSLQKDAGQKIELVHDKATYRFLLMSGRETVSGKPRLSLLLTKATAAIAKKFTGFLLDTFQGTLAPLKLPSALLQEALHAYLSTLGAEFPSDSTPSLRQPTTIQSIIGNLKVTVTFGAPVAPHLKTMDIDIPPDSVTKLLQQIEKAKQEDNSTRRNRTNGQRNGGNESANTDTTLLGLLAELIEARSGIRIPITTTNPTASSTGTTSPSPSTNATTTNAAPSPNSEQILRISKITSAAFALSVDGRLKFAAKAVQSAVGEAAETLVRMANGEMLERIVRAADGGGEEDEEDEEEA